MAYSATPAFGSTIDPADAIIFRDSATPSAAALAMGPGGWLSLDYGFIGSQFTSTLINTFGAGDDPGAPDRGREHVIVAGVVQAGWTVTPTVLGTNDLQLEVSRDAGWIDAAHILELEPEPNPSGSSVGPGSVGAPAAGLQTFTLTGPTYTFTAGDIGSLLTLYDGSFAIIVSNAPILSVPAGDSATFSNPSGSAGAVAIAVLSVPIPVASVTATVNGSPASISPSAGETKNTQIENLVSAINALALPSVTAYIGQRNAPGSLGAAAIVLGSGLSSLVGAGSYVETDRVAQARLWYPSLLGGSHPYAPPWYFVITAAAPPSSTFRLLAASPIDSRAVRVWLSEEPRRTSTIGPQDASNRLIWTVALVSGPSGASAPVVEAVENIRAAPSEIAGEPDAWALDLRVDRPILARASFLALADAGLLSAAGDAILPSPNDRAAFPGAAATMPRASRSSATRRLGEDLRYDFFSGAFVLTPAGDLATHTGQDALRKRILRRLTTGRGAFAHLPDYGLDLRAKELRRDASAAALSAAIEAQVMMEEGVVAARALVDDGTPGLLIVQIAAQTRLNQSVDLSIGVTDGGLIEVGGL